MKGQNVEKCQQKDSTCCLKLIRKQEITLFLCCTTKCPTEAEKIENANMSCYWLWRPNWNQVQQNFHSCTITASNEKTCKNQYENKKSNDFFDAGQNITVFSQKDDKNKLIILRSIVSRSTVLN